jgi:hypothetical protein
MQQHGTDRDSVKQRRPLLHGWKVAFWRLIAHSLHEVVKPCDERCAQLLWQLHKHMHMGFHIQDLTPCTQ